MRQRSSACQALSSRLTLTGCGVRGTLTRSAAGPRSIQESTVGKRRAIASLLLRLPLRAKRSELRERIEQHKEWFAAQIMADRSLDRDAAVAQR